VSLSPPEVVQDRSAGEFLLHGHTVMHLRADGVSLLLRLAPDRLPEVVHWGHALGPVDDGAAAIVAAAVHEQDPVAEAAGRDDDGLAIVPSRPSADSRSVFHEPVIAEHWRSWFGRPGISGSRDGTSWSPRFDRVRLAVTGGVARPSGDLIDIDGPALISFRAQDVENALGLQLEIELRASGLIRLRTTLRNLGANGSALFSLDDVRMRLALPDIAVEALDFTGRWALERIPQRAPIVVGVRERENRRGRNGADAAYLTIAGEPGFSFGAGQVWGVHLAWSGNGRQFVERLSNGAQSLGGGELLLPGEVRLAGGEEYRTPWLYAGHADGLDALAARFHDEVRSSAPRRPAPQPVTLNTWEALYFDHSEDAVLALAERAAVLGIERFVVDDGWFLGRRSERAGLGDWTVDPVVYPHGLRPIADRVHALGMQFGLWVEPEMISADSELARRHPEWVLRAGSRLPVEERYQQVLDLTRPDAFEYVLDLLTSLIDETGADALKWDHNRDLVDAGGANGSGAVHRQTTAVYRLIDLLRTRFPGLEIESCSSGGARIDLGILARTDRVWASDVLDPIERTAVNRWTAQLVPPEFIGSHVASERSHITGRRSDLSFRAATSLLFGFGVEWDVTGLDDVLLGELSDWIALHRRLRPLIAHGRLTRLDHPDPSLAVSGIVAHDRSHAVFVATAVTRPTTTPRARIRFRGLDPDAAYHVRPLLPGALPAGLVAPPWFGPTGRGVVVSGGVLLRSGLRMPPIAPEHALVIEMRTYDGAPATYPAACHPAPHEPNPNTEESQR